jgi:nucleotide-binding universal stress UspA family protein
MQIESLMVHLDASPASEARLALAASMARSLGARLIGVAAGRSVAVGDVADRPEARLADVAEIERMLEMAEESFARTGANLDGASFRSDFADALGFLGLNARAADLVIVGPGPAEAERTALSVAPEDALFEVGRPILFSPAALQGWIGEHVLIAWKDCKEARRAVYEALPVLARARQVTVLALNEDHSFEGHDDVVAYLEAHDIRAGAMSGEAHFGAVGETIIATAQEVGAELIVAGAFSRSRGHERVFGGVTLDLLTKSTTPVLFAH